MVKLKYMGTGEYQLMIPNRDLTDFDITTIAAREGVSEDELITRICSRGLYKPVKAKSSKNVIKLELKEIAKSEIDREEGQ